MEINEYCNNKGTIEGAHNIQCNVLALPAIVFVPYANHDTPTGQIIYIFCACTCTNLRATVSLFLLSFLHLLLLYSFSICLSFFPSQTCIHVNK